MVLAAKLGRGIQGRMAERIVQVPTLLLLRRTAGILLHLQIPRLRGLLRCASFGALLVGMSANAVRSCVAQSRYAKEDRDT